jgi:hypothetical protein
MIKPNILSISGIVLMLLGATGCSDCGCEEITHIDYSNMNNWGMVDVVDGNKADCFYVYPTVISTEEDSVSINDQEMRTEARKLFYAYRDIFAPANFYAPFYRQLSISYISKQTNAEGAEKIIKEGPLVDAIDSFEYYLDHFDTGKPIIFASHSQGTMILKELLFYIRENHPDILDRMVSAYLIGYGINQDYLDKVELPFATGESDTGSIVSYNTEAPVTDSNNPFTMWFYNDCFAINPVNWVRDDTYAPATTSKLRGEDTDSGLAETKENFADAQINIERGTVVTNADVVADPAWWPLGILHHFDYDLFYYSLKDNVKNRIDAFYGKY